MATTYNNAQIGVVDASGNLNVIYPITKATNVAYKSTNVDAKLTSLQSAVDTLNSNLSTIKNITSLLTCTDTSGVSGAGTHVIECKFSTADIKQNTLGNGGCIFLRGYRYPVIKSIFIIYNRETTTSPTHKFIIVSESTCSSGVCTIAYMEKGFSLTYSGGNTWSIDNVLLIQ